MARTRGCRATIIRRQRAVLIVSLPFQNPTAVERRLTTAGAGPALGVTTRARSRRIAAAVAAAVAALPEEILVSEIFVRLPVKDILRCRAVCRYWRGLTSAPDFLLAHNRRQPSRLLLTLYSTDSADPIFKCGHPILGLIDFRGFKIKASCDGLLVLYRSNGCFSICNPVTRQCTELQCLTETGHINTAALYLHRPSGEYRILYWNHRAASYYILMVSQGSSPRCIGVPSDTLGIDKDVVAWNRMATTNLVSPVVFRNCLHWDTSSDAGILVFDTVLESFGLMRRPTAATGLCTRLCDMEGSIGFSCFGDGKRVAKIWVLEDYEREVWSLKYQVQIPVWYFKRADIEHLVLSHKGDVLLYSPSFGCMCHCDNTGTSLQTFPWNSWSMSLIIGPWFKESLVKHDSLMPGHASVGQLRFF